MKNYLHQFLILFGLYISSFNSGFTQISIKDYDDFFDAVKNKNDSIIARKGEYILSESKIKKYKVDSSLIEIRIFTALSYYNLRNPKRSIELNTETYELLKASSDLVYFQKLIACMHNLALAEEMQEHYEKALNWNLKSVSTIKNSIGTDNNLYISELSNLASSYSDLYQDSVALEINLEILNYLNLGEHDYKGIAKTLNNISLNYSAIGNFLKALEFSEKALQVIEINFGTENRTYASYLHNCADFNFELGKVDVAIELSQDAVKIKKKLLGPLHGDYASSLSMLAHYYSNIGNVSEAIKLKLKVVEICKYFYGETHSIYANALSALSLEYFTQGDSQLALKYNMEALKIREKVFGPDHPDCAISLTNIASVYSSMGEYDKSIEYLQKSAEIIENKKGRISLDFAHVMSDLALALSHRDSEVALKLNFEVLEIIEQIRGKKNLAYATALNNIALIYSDLDQYNKSLMYHFDALEIKKTIYGEFNINICVNLDNIASVYGQLGQLEEANIKLQNVEKIVLDTYGNEHIEYAYALFGIANNYYLQNNFKKAQQYYNLSLQIIKKKLGKSNPYVSSIYNNLALVYIKMGDYKTSMKFNKLALGIRRNSFGVNSLEYAVTLNNLGESFYYMSKYKKALRLFKKSMAIEEDIIKKNDNSFVTSLFNISSCYHQLGMHEQAIKYSYNSLELFKNNFVSLTPSMPNEIMLKHKEKLVSIWNKTSNILIERLDNINDYYTQWLSLNGLLSINLNKLDNDIELLPVLKNKLDSIRIIKQELNRQIENIAYSDVKEIYNLKDSLLVMELILNNYYTDNYKFSRNYISNISFYLNEQAVLVDIVKIPTYDFKNSIWLNSSNYVIFISDSKDTLVDYIFIKDGTKIDQDLFDQYQQEATDPERKTDLTSEKFYNYFWKPIADKIGDAKTIYVSLGGVYNNINLNTIYNPETGKYLLEEKDIRIVNSAREFILNKERETKIYTNNTASLFGFPNFDGNSTVTADASDLFASTRDLNSFWLDSLTRGGLKAKPLPATKTEVENISSTLKSKGWQVTSYLADNASETNIKTQQSPRVLHVATHGYFFPDIPMEDKDQTRFLGMDRQQVVQDPMLRSGLLLTGANRTLKGGSSTGENGLLSAAEASLLDLRETELVVLSACETGKGEVKNSEGVYGLRKAFSDAGAQNIIMSLWKVDDKVTQEFMSQFYEIWLNDKTSIREAFNRTQLEIKAKYSQPYYWGAFILVGD